MQRVLLELQAVHGGEGHGLIEGTAAAVLAVQRAGLDAHRHGRTAVEGDRVLGLLPATQELVQRRMRQRVEHGRTEGPSLTHRRTREAPILELGPTKRFVGRYQALNEDRSQGDGESRKNQTTRWRRATGAPCRTVSTQHAIHSQRCTSTICPVDHA